MEWLKFRTCAFLIYLKSNRGHQPEFMKDVNPSYDFYHPSIPYLRIMKWMVIGVWLCSFPLFSQHDPRADSLGIPTTTLHVYPDFSTGTLNMQATLTLKCIKGPISKIQLDLEKLTVDSVIHLGNALSYSQSSPLLDIQLNQPIQIGDSVVLDIYYHGKPATDPSGFGGFYFSGPYAFNIGVAFSNNPHNYGRSWFPCLDNFVTRTVYTTHIYSQIPYVGVASGNLLLWDSSAGKNHLAWEMKRDIPSYLLGISIAPYHLVNNLLIGSIPSTLAVLPSDTLNLKKSFIHLPEILSGLIHGYGFYPFERVGYAAVPFNSGAMEHACNIAYPVSGIDGTLEYEKLISHELSHMWWGNNTTCRQASEMWLNEGWASYSEAQAMETIYGYENGYQSTVADNHLEVIWDGHHRDSAYRAIVGLPHQHTYGSTVYDKGADVVRTLRGYMDSTSFFQACKSFQQLYYGKAVSTEDLKNHFEKYYIYGSLNPFFKGWVYQPGFPHLRIEDPQWNQGKWQAVVQQDLVGAPNYWDSIPLEIRFLYKNDTIGSLHKIWVSGKSTTVSINTANEPTAYVMDPFEKLADAITMDKVRFPLLLPDSFQSIPHALCSLSAPKNISVPYIYVEHHWAGSAGWTDRLGLYVSPNRYWSFHGDFDTLQNVSIQFPYNGTLTRFAGYLDNRLIPGAEDSLKLLYRPHGTKVWTPVSQATLVKGLRFDKKGYFQLKGLQAGEYTIGTKDARLGADWYQENEWWKIEGNPVKEVLQLNIQDEGQFRVWIMDTQGRMMKDWTMTKGVHQLDISSITAKGLYHVGIQDIRQPAKLQVKNVVIY